MADMDLKKTIAPVVDRDLCHGCGTCVASCPLATIELTRDNRRGTRLFIPTFELYKTAEYTFAPRRLRRSCREQ